MIGDDSMFEIESLSAILAPSADLEVLNAESSVRFTVFPEPEASLDKNYVYARLKVHLPPEYPYELPFTVQVEADGTELTSDARTAVDQAVAEAVEAFAYMPAMYQLYMDVGEALRPHNQPMLSLADQRNAEEAAAAAAAARAAELAAAAAEKENDAATSHIRELFGERFEEHGELPGAAFNADAYMNWWKAEGLGGACLLRDGEAMERDIGPTCVADFESDASRVLGLADRLLTDHGDAYARDLDRLVRGERLTGRQYMMLKRLALGLVSRASLEAMHTAELADFRALQATIV